MFGGNTCTHDTTSSKSDPVYNPQLIKHNNKTNDALVNGKSFLQEGIADSQECHVSNRHRSKSNCSEYNSRYKHDMEGACSYEILCNNGSPVIDYHHYPPKTLLKVSNCQLSPHCLDFIGNRERRAYSETSVCMEPCLHHNLDTTNYINKTPGSPTLHYYNDLMDYDKASLQYIELLKHDEQNGNMHRPP